LKIVHQHRRRYRKPKAQPTFSSSPFRRAMSGWKPDLRFCEALYPLPATAG